MASLLINAIKMIDVNVKVCPGNCNDRGACVSGNCICEVRYSGGNCTDSNLGYNVGFGLTFSILCVVSFIQLVLCIGSEFRKLKRPSIAKACRPTVQKMVYICMIIACGSRGVYHSIQEYLPGWLGPNLFSVYYPIIMSGFSLIICFWAETFHIEGLRLDKPRFLNKSSIGFIIFNVFIYLVLAVQVITIEVTDVKTKIYLHNIFNGIFAALMFLVLIFFLIYGVELYYMVRGAFITRPSNVDCAQVAMSRLGLISQAVFQLLTALYLMGDVMGKVWKDKLPVDMRNMLEILFRVFEVAVALWFPCCFWNWKSPHQLWILNPKKLLRHEQTNNETKRLLLPSDQTPYYNSIAPAQESDQECWICYDNERTDDMIYPCQCKGDMAAVHHECLRRWLLESCTGDSQNIPRCKVCNEEYSIKISRVWLPSGLNIRYWLQTIIVLAVMVTSPIGAYLLCISNDVATACKVLITGVAVILEYLCLRLLGFNMVGAYRRARLIAITVIGRNKHSNQEVPKQESTDNTVTPSTPTA